MSVPNQPTNLNFLSPVGFQLKVDRLPLTTFFAQGANLPGMSLPAVAIRTPLATLQSPGDTLAFDPLTIRFRVSEDLANYMEIANWMRGLGHPQALTQYKTLAETTVGATRSGSIPNVVSDATLIILTSNNNASKSVQIYHMFPTSLSALQFDVSQADITYLEAEAQFMYRDFEILDP